MEDWLQIAHTFGVPVAVMAAMLVAVFRGAKWLGPRLDKLFDRHNLFLDAMASTQLEIKENLVALTTQSTERSEYGLRKLDAIHEGVGRIEGQVGQIRNTLDGREPREGEPHA